MINPAGWTTYDGCKTTISGLQISSQTCKAGGCMAVLLKTLVSQLLEVGDAIGE
jgi:hypothetical protein